jgi:hypothetical protein
MLKASARSAVEPFLAMDVMSAAATLEAAGRTIVHMEVGQPGAAAPAPVLAAAAEAIRHGRLGYTEALGIRPLRERIAQHYREAYGIDVPASRVMVTTGSSGGFNLIFLGAFDPGARTGTSSRRSDLKRSKSRSDPLRAGRCRRSRSRRRIAATNLTACSWPARPTRPAR